MQLTGSLEIMLIVFLAAAVISDFRDHRIPNLITLFAAVVGVSSHIYLGGLQGAGFALGGLALGVACLLPFYLLGGMGAGDVKLIGAIGAFVGAPAVLLAAAVGLVCGAFGAIGVLLWSFFSVQRAATREYPMQQTAVPMTPGHRGLQAAPARQALKIRFPYALALSLGAIASLVYLRF